MALTSDEVSQDNHGNVEVTTPRLSQDGYARTKFPAISEEDRTSDSEDSDAMRMSVNRASKEPGWALREHLPRDGSGDTGERSLYAIISTGLSSYSPCWLQSYNSMRSTAIFP